MRKETVCRLSIALLMMVMLLMTGCAGSTATKQASVDGPPEITSIQIEDNNVVIRASRGFTYTLSHADPYRASVEIPGMTVGMFGNKIISDKAGISEIVPQQIGLQQPFVRIDLVLQKPAVVSSSYEENVLKLAVSQSAQQEEKTTEVSMPAPAAMSEQVVEKVAVTEVPAATAAVVEERPVARKAAVEPAQQAAPRATEISGVEVRKAGSTVKVLITGNGTLIPNVFPINERIVIDIPDVTLKASLPENIASPLKGIRAGRHKEKLRLVLDLREKANFDVTAIGNTIEISLLGGSSDAAARTVAYAEDKPKEVRKSDNGTPALQTAPMRAEPAIPETQASEPAKMSDKKISLDFQDADIVPIFKLLAEIGGYNLVVHPQVTGKITLKLINVPWEQAMGMVLRTFDLTAKTQGNVIRIVPSAIATKEVEDAAKHAKLETEVGELQTRIFPINYADLSKLKDSVDKAKVLSSRGNITLDERGSSIIVNDLPQNLERVDALIKQLDQESMQARQVMIEAKIVEVNVDYVKELGISWGAFWQGPKHKRNEQFIFSKGGTNTEATFGPDGSITDVTISPFIDLPAAVGPGSGGQFGFGYINAAANLFLQTRLSALESTNNGKIISNPRVMTMNNQEAKITQGRTIYLPTATADKADFKAIDALLSLTVKPRIAPGGAIFIDLDITKDEPTAATAGGVDVLKNTVKTSVLVNNSDTLVIGGIYKKSNTEENDGFPGLSKIPILGYLFKKERKVEANTEMLVFITPTIVNLKDLK